MSRGLTSMCRGPGVKLPSVGRNTDFSSVITGAVWALFRL